MENVFDLTNILVWDYDKGRSITPERWNDPLDYEDNCEEHYLLSRGVTVGNSVHLYGRYMNSVEDCLYPPTIDEGYLIGKIKKEDVHRIIDRKHVDEWWPKSHSARPGVDPKFSEKSLRLDVCEDTPKEYYDWVIEQDF